MTKPFSIEELLARITATLRRTRVSAQVESAAAAVNIGELRIDLAAQQVTRAAPAGAPDSDRVRPPA